MPRVLLIHRKPEVASERAQRLAAAGMEASAYPVLGASAFRIISANPPDAILIDLTELPSYGRTMGVLLRQRKDTRHIPLVFLKGDPAKAARVREVLPGSVFATWPDVAPAIERAIEHAPADPAAPRITATPLAQKLRIEENFTVALLQAPPDILRILGPLPKGVHLKERAGDAELILLFVRSAAALSCALPPLARDMQRGRTLWICWPKRSSAEKCDLSPNRIREIAAPCNLVDSRLCAIDDVWSGTALTKRRKPPHDPDIGA